MAKELQLSKGKLEQSKAGYQASSAAPELMAGGRTQQAKSQGPQAGSDYGRLEQLLATEGSEENSLLLGCYRLIKQTLSDSLW